MLVWGTQSLHSSSRCWPWGRCGGSSSSWLLPGAEFLAVINFFALVCLLESSGNNAERSNPAA